LIFEIDLATKILTPSPLSAPNVARDVRLGAIAEQWFFISPLSLTRSTFLFLEAAKTFHPQAPQKHWRQDALTLHGRAPFGGQSLDRTKRNIQEPIKGPGTTFFAGFPVSSPPRLSAGNSCRQFGVRVETRSRSGP
jgi:hypothetical protein